MPYSSNQSPIKPRQTPPGGLLRRAFQQTQPSVPPEQWLTRERPSISSRQITARQPAHPRQAPPGPYARPPVPEDAASPDARSRSNRWIMLGIVLVLLLGGLWAIGHLGAGVSTQSSQTPRPTLAPNAPTPTAHPASASATPAASPTPTASAASSIRQITVQFLAAYFTWSVGESNEAYISRWRSFVADAAARDLIQSAPRLTLDAGDDSAASNSAPTIPTSAIKISSQQAQVHVAWTIRVLPPGGEQVQWQPRRIQATITLMQGASGWQITNAAWSSASR